ncbi:MULTISPECIES: HutD family protein [unclassified Phenylobacterium]|uniref:HutD/Ves family protein n=1 Tax=unclassified Phenylobacterium TaxID=2640670 RepID=UPI00083B1D5F|nr:MULTISPECIES: HutD family protein [unclassified Phenylobacterium]
MSATLLHAADRVATPWKNGGGVTREVTVWPPGAGFGDFHWRVSMAEVRVDGPFSMFPGVDRILAVLEGRLALAVAPFGEFDLSPTGAPAAFPGDAPATARVLEGPVLDLNLMARRGVAHATLDRLQVGAPQTLEAVVGHRLVIATGGALRVVAGDQAHELAPLDAVLFGSGDGPLRLEANRSTPTHLVRVRIL